MLATLILLCVAAYVGATKLISRTERQSIERLLRNLPESATTLFRFLYGDWSSLLAQLSPEPEYDKHLAAYIVTDMETSGSWIGYEGEVEGLTLDADKQIAAVTLRNCQAFRLRPTRTKLDHQVLPRKTAIPRLMIERSEFRNVALQVVYQRKATPVSPKATT